MYKWFALMLVFAFGCKQRPYSKDYVFTFSDDHLSLQDKVLLLRESASENDDALLASIASLYAQNKNWSEAKTSITKAIKLNPLDASYHLYLANYNVELNEPALAYAEAKIANDLEAYDPKLEALLAHMAIETGDTVEGSTFVKNYYKANSDNPEAKLLMARQALYEKNYVNAYNLVQEGLKADSLNEQGWQSAFAVYKQVDSVNKAIKSGYTLIKLDSANANYYDQLAELFKSIGDNTRSTTLVSESYQLKPSLDKLLEVIDYYEDIQKFDSVLFVTDSSFSKVNYRDKEVILARARAFDKKYKYDLSYATYAQLLKMDSTDTVALAEQAIVQRKIAYLQRKKQEQKRLADSLSNTMPTINF